MDALNSAWEPVKNFFQEEGEEKLDIPRVAGAVFVAGALLVNVAHLASGRVTCLNRSIPVSFIDVTKLVTWIVGYFFVACFCAVHKFEKTFAPAYFALGATVITGVCYGGHPKQLLMHGVAMLVSGFAAKFITPYFSKDNDKPVEVSFYALPFIALPVGRAVFGAPSQGMLSLPERAVRAVLCRNS